MPSEEPPGKGKGKGKRNHQDGASTGSSSGPAPLPDDDDDAMNGGPEPTSSSSSSAADPPSKRQRRFGGRDDEPGLTPQDDTEMEDASDDGSEFWDRWETPVALSSAVLPDSRPTLPCSGVLQPPMVSPGSNAEGPHDFKLLMWNIENLGGGNGRLAKRRDDDIAAMARILVNASADVSVIVEVREVAGTGNGAAESATVQFLQLLMGDTGTPRERAAKKNVLLAKFERVLAPILWELYFSEELTQRQRRQFDEDLKECAKARKNQFYDDLREFFENTPIPKHLDWEHFYAHLFATYQGLTRSVDAHLAKLVPGRTALAWSQQGKLALKTLRGEIGPEGAMTKEYVERLHAIRSKRRSQGPLAEEQYLQNMLNLKLFAQLPVFPQLSSDPPASDEQPALGLDHSNGEGKGKGKGKGKDKGDSTGVAELGRIVQQMNELAPGAGYDYWPKPSQAKFSAGETYGFIYKPHCQFLECKWVPLNAPSFSRLPMLARFRFRSSWLRVVAWHAPSDSPQNLYRRTDMFADFIQWCENREKLGEVPLFMAADLNVATQGLASKRDPSSPSSSSSMSMSPAASAAAIEDTVSHCAGVTVKELLRAVAPSEQWSSSRFLAHPTTVVKTSFEIAPAILWARPLWQKGLAAEDTLAINSFVDDTPFTGHLLNAFDKITVVCGVRNKQVSRLKEEIIDNVDDASLLRRLLRHDGHDVELVQTLGRRHLRKDDTQREDVRAAVNVMRSMSDHIPISVNYRINF